MATQDATISPRLDTTAAPGANLFLVEALDDPERTRGLAPGDLDALRAVVGWIRSFIVRPNPDLGRAGPVCPFVPGALEHRTLWLAPEHSAGRSRADVVGVIEGYQRRLLAAPPVDGDVAGLKSIMIVFTDLPAARAQAFFDGIPEQIGLPSYARDGLVMGPFYEGNAGTAIYNPNFRPFTPPVPFWLMRRAVASDWKFFLDNEEWFRLWARRHGEAGTDALAAELRRLPWRARRE